MGGGGISSRIYASVKPTKLNYTEGEQLDLSGMVINFKDGNEEPLAVSNFKSIPANGSILSRNDEVVQIEYQKDETAYLLAIPIKVKYPVDIEVSSFPKSSYRPKDTLNTNGLKINIIYNDGSIKEIDSGITTTPSNGTALNGITEIKISYENFYTHYKLNIDTVSEVVNKSALISNYLATFKSATPTQMEELLKFHYNGDLNLKDYWKVGDYREVTVGSNKYTFTIVDIDKTINGEKYALILIEKNIDVLHNCISTHFNINLNYRAGSRPSLPIGNSLNNKYKMSYYEYGNDDSRYFLYYIKNRNFEPDGINFKKSPYVVTFNINYSINRIEETDTYKLKFNSVETLLEENRDVNLKTTPLILEFVDGENAFEYFKTKSNLFYSKLINFDLPENQYITYKISDYWNSGTIYVYGIQSNNARDIKNCSLSPSGVVKNPINGDIKLFLNERHSSGTHNHYGNASEAGYKSLLFV